jgi:CheY-like chemotaxis protein
MSPLVRGRFEATDTMVWPLRNWLEATYELSHRPTPARYSTLPRKIKHIAGRIVDLERQSRDQEEIRSVLELSSSSAPRILVLDDEKSIVELIVIVLRGAGFTVVGTQSPFEAIAICENLQARIDLVLCDVHMPGLKGIQFADRVRNTMPNARFVFMTGDVNAREDLIAKGFICLQKPFIFSELVWRLQGILTSEAGRRHAG